MNTANTPRSALLPYLLVVLIALLLGASLYAIMLVTGCSGSQPGNPSNTGSDISSEINGSWGPPQNPSMASGALQSSTAGSWSAGDRFPAPALASSVGALASGELVTLTWTPPPGSANFQFDRAPDPGGPPFVWRGVPSSLPIHVQYDLPDLPAGQTEAEVVAVLEVEFHGLTAATSLATHVTQGVSRATSVTLLASPAANEPTTLWQIGRFIDPQGFTLTTQLCDDWLGRMQSEDVFVAVQVPIAAGPSVTASVGVPVAAGGLYSSSLQLGDYAAPSPAITVPLTLRPQRFTFLANALPAAPGEMWVAMGLDLGMPVACPPGLIAPANRWGMLFTTRLNLTHQPDNCEGCILPLYFCAEGEEKPLPLAVASLVLPAATTYQSDGITCVGPQSMSLRTYPSTWNLGHTSSVAVTPTQTISLMHTLRNPGLTPVTVTVSHNLAMGVDWRIYRGNSAKPNLGEPIVGPLMVGPSNGVFIWLISDPVPTTGVSGSQTLIVTATSMISPADLRWIGDLIWVGSWAPPPPPLPPPAGHDLFLPLVRR